VAHHFKRFGVEQVNNIRPRAGEKIVHAKNFIALFDQAIAQMAADKTSAAADKDSRGEMHNARRFKRLF